MNKIYFWLETMISYDFWTKWLWINFDIQTNVGYLLVLWYPTNGGRSLVLWYPNQWGSFIGKWGLFIGILIPKPMGVIHWLFIGTLIPKPMGVIHWFSDTQPMKVIHWYFDAQSREYSMTIVIKLLRIWITFEYLTILSH